MIRKAQLEDAPAIGELNVTVWRAAYRGLVDQAVLDGLSVKRAIAGWRGQLIGGSDRSGIFVTPDEGPVAGYGSFGPSRDDDATSSTGEVLTIYVHPDAWSTGAGRALLMGMEQEMRALGFDEAMLWVLAGNDRAQAFYDRQGWVADGSEKDQRIFDTLLHEVRYRKSLVT